MLEHENIELDNIYDIVNEKNTKDIKYRSKICLLEEQVMVLNQQLMEFKFLNYSELVIFGQTALEKQARSGVSLQKFSETASFGEKGDDVQEQNNP